MSLCNGATSYFDGYVASMHFINKNVYFRFRFSILLIFTNKATILLDDGLYRKISARRQFNPMKTEHWLYDLFYNGYRAIK